MKLCVLCTAGSIDFEINCTNFWIINHRTPNADHNNTSQATTDASESPIANEGDTEVSFFECLIQECLPERYRESWSKMIFPDVIRYLYWPRDEKLCKKYVEIDKNLYAKVLDA